MCISPAQYARRDAPTMTMTDVINGVEYDISPRRIADFVQQINRGLCEPIAPMLLFKCMNKYPRLQDWTAVTGGLITIDELLMARNAIATVINLVAGKPPLSAEAEQAAAGHARRHRDRKHALAAARRQRIGVWVRARREALDMSQLALSTTLGMYQGVISTIENGRIAAIGPSTLARLETVLGPYIDEESTPSSVAMETGRDGGDGQQTESADNVDTEQRGRGDGRSVPVDGSRVLGGDEGSGVAR